MSAFVVQISIREVRSKQWIFKWGVSIMLGLFLGYCIFRRGLSVMNPYKNSIKYLIKIANI